MKTFYHYLFSGLIIASVFTTPCMARDSPIAIDVGHSKIKPGSISASGRPEFEFNLVLAKTLSDLMALHGVSVLPINYAGDVNDLKARTKVAAAGAAKFFLSVHHDSVQPQYLRYARGTLQRYSDYAAGFSLFVSRKNPALSISLDCARAIGMALRNFGFRVSPHHAEKIAGENREWADQLNGVYYYDDLVVLKTASMPAVLLEAGVIVNPSEEQNIQKGQTRTAIAVAVEDGLQQCGIIEKTLRY